VTQLVEPTDLELIRKIAAAGGRKYTAGNLDRRKYQRLVALGWLTEVTVNISDVVYEGGWESGRASRRLRGAIAAARCARRCVILARGRRVPRQRGTHPRPHARP
jgi:hypothetical protein